MDLEIPHSLLCDELFKVENSRRNKNLLMNFVKSEYNISDAEEIKKIEPRLQLFLDKFKLKLRAALYNEKQFRKQHADWLLHIFKITINDNCSKGGRTCSGDFDKCSTSTKRRKIIALTEQYSAELIKQAFFKNLRDSGNKMAIQLITNILENGIALDPKETILPFNEDECIALIENTKLSRYQYDTIRKLACEKNADIFVPYYRLTSAKQRCYPSYNDTNNENDVNDKSDRDESDESDESDDIIQITEKRASVHLQELLNHTCSRILQIPEVLAKIAEYGPQLSLVMTSKWGCDGASNPSRYKQIFSDGTTDASIFMVCLVPLTLEVDGQEGRQIIWRNPQSGSTRNCRLISIEYTKETSDKTRMAVKEIEEQIESLILSSVETNYGTLKVSHTLYLTMIDGKVCQAFTKIPSSASCTICQATPSQMNDFDKLSRKQENKENFKYGLSTLHAWIRFMECIIHIAYRLPFCSWSAKTEQDKAAMKNEKQRIQQEYLRRTGLLIDYPQQQSGNSDDENTARRFFRDSALAAEITKVDQRLIERFGIILQVTVKIYIYCFTQNYFNLHLSACLK